MRNRRFQKCTRVLAAFAAIVLVSSTASAQIFTRAGVLGANGGFDSPNFGAPPISTVGLNADYFFDAFLFFVSQSGSYSFGLTTSFDDLSDPDNSNGGALFLYANSFNPAAPLNNIVFGASSVPFPGNPGLPISATLTTGTPYTVVVSSFLNATTGSYTASISCPPTDVSPNGGCAPGQIGLPPTTVPEPSTVVLSATGLLALAFFARRRRVS